MKTFLLVSKIGNEQRVDTNVIIHKVISSSGKLAMLEQRLCCRLHFFDASSYPVGSARALHMLAHFMLRPALLVYLLSCIRIIYSYSTFILFPNTTCSQHLKDTVHMCA